MLQKGSELIVRHTRAARQWRVVGMTVFLFLGLVSFSVVHAQTSGGLNQASNSVNTVSAAAGVPSTDLYSLIGRIINVGFGLVGLVLLGYLLYAGWLWMTAGGDTEKTQQAMTTIRNAVIGLVILAASFAIVGFILSQLSQVAGFGTGSETITRDEFHFPIGAGALGGGPIEYHLPARDATNVPRNTSIIISFKVPIRLSSIIQGYDDAGTPADLTDDHPATDLNTSAFKIIRRDPTGGREELLPGNQVEVHFTEDRQTFVLRPRAWLGSPTVNTPYRVELPAGLSGLLVENNQADRRASIFGPEFPSGYRWQFEVSTLVDLTPPQIVSVVPAHGVHPPNTVLQINFSEAVDPTSASGIFRAGRGFDIMELTATPVAGGTPTRVEGQFRIANHYTTVEFTTFEICGTNACGHDVYCLPRVSALDLLVKAATLSASPPQAAPVTTHLGSIFDGVVDVAGNSLDGNANGTAQGPPDDHYRASFSTSQDADLRPPRIRSTIPPIGNDRFPSGSSEIPVTQEPQITFGAEDATPEVNIPQASTINSTNVAIARQNEPPELTGDTFWWTPALTLLSRLEAMIPPGDALYGRVGIQHRAYIPLPAPVAGRPTPLAPVYAPVLNSGVQNLLQNCFKPSASVRCSATSREPNCCDGERSSDLCPFSRLRP